MIAVGCAPLLAHRLRRCSFWDGVALRLTPSAASGSLWLLLRGCRLGIFFWGVQVIMEKNGGVLREKLPGDQRCSQVSVRWDLETSQSPSSRATLPGCTLAFLLPPVRRKRRQVRVEAALTRQPIVSQFQTDVWFPAGFGQKALAFPHICRPYLARRRWL